MPTALNIVWLKRNLWVRDWCAEWTITWREFVQDGVIRGRKHRWGWAEHNDAFLAGAQVQSEGGQESIWGPTDLGVAAFADQDLDRYLEPGNDRLQRGGKTAAWCYLRLLTAARGVGYAHRLG